MKIIKLIYGIALYIPGVYNIFSKGTGGTISARYCYSVWLRHLVMAYKNNLPTNPKVVAELGPGDSLGIGLTALLTGADTYYAFDVFKYANIKENIKVFDVLITLLKNRENIPGDDEFPKVSPHLDSYSFPDYVLTDERLNNALKEDRIEYIRNAIINMNSDKSIIKYAAPWYNSNIIKEESVDMIYSQAVLEHIDDLPTTYKAMYSWLKPTGFISHTIDFKCHSTANSWNGHWTYSDFTWRLMRGNRPYLLNREPHSTHIRLLKNFGFEIVYDLKTIIKSEINRSHLARRFKDISDDDLTISGSFMQAKKQGFSQ